MVAVSRAVASGNAIAFAVVGDEDGAHQVSAELFQGLSDVGFTAPTAIRNAVHLARLLLAQPFPAG